MQFFQTRSKKSGILAVLLAVTIAAIVAFLPNLTLPAHADDAFCQGQAGVTCNMVFADGYANNPVILNNTGVGSSSLRVTLNAYQITGNSDNNHYMLFRVTVTLDPASFQNRVASKPVFGFAPPADTSPDGERSTIQVRLWSGNARTTPCPTSSCIQSGGLSLQQNDPDLEKPFDCTPDGGSQSSTWTASSLNVGWTISVPTYQWCMYAVPNVDMFSRYYNYALENANQQSVPITQDFVFAQEEPGNINQFKIGFSVTSNLVDIAGPGPLYMAGPSIGSTPATFTI